MITVSHLTKRFGDRAAVSDLTFSVNPGVVTGFLGPNGSGKSTTMRVILGLIRPTSGSATINGRPYRELEFPMREVGALLDAKAVHPGRSARHHLKSLATANAISAQRVDEVLDIVGLTDVADQRAGKFSLGMSQRLGIAAAILGDPGILMFDEPINGLDPEGIRWIREFFQSLADEGRAVLVSSHLMSEMSLVAERFIIIGRGQLIREGSRDELAKASDQFVFVRTPHRETFKEIAARENWAYREEGETFVLEHVFASEVGEIAFAHQLPLHELSTKSSSLEDLFMKLTADSVEYVGKQRERRKGANR
ncbi:MAG: ABC transporter ATP-binding protein [Acidobacteria bacterium]|nr:ABC transporter ATP-binding protein [Acidobacteriota bacterium]